MIKGKNPEQIRRTFNIVNDFTPVRHTNLTRRVAAGGRSELGAFSKIVVKSALWSRQHARSPLTRAV